MKERRIKRLKRRAKKATGKRKTRLTNKAATITKRKEKQKQYVGVNIPITF